MRPKADQKIGLFFIQKPDLSPMKKEGLGDIFIIEMEKLRVLIADDNPPIREQIRTLLELEEDIEVVGEAANGQEAVDKTSLFQPDLVLMDKVMPSLDGLEATRLIKGKNPKVRVIFLAAEDAWRQEALQAGAQAYFLKDRGFDAVVETIRKAIRSHPAERMERDLRPGGWLIDGFRRLWAHSPALTAGLLILFLIALSDVALLLLPLSGLELLVRLLIHHSLAAISLLFGVFFFAYALKYYANIALILLFNGENGLVNGNGHGQSKGLRNGLGNGLRKVFGNGVDTALTNGHQLKPGAQPFVSIHLPLYNEMEVVDRLLTACTSLDYENYEVIVADDSTDETTKILEQRWSKHPRVKISHRQDRKGFKGGALQVALQRTDPRAEFIIVFDADFLPPPDIIPQFLAYFYNGNGDGQGLADDRVAVVQGYQWHMLNANENWITRGVRVEFSGSYVIERPGQQLFGSMKMIAGSVFMIRADVLRKHGWSTSITEDWELTLRLYLDGYKVLYTPFIQAPAECVSRFQQLVRQRMRWARGHTFNVKRYFWRVLTSPHISWREKAEFLYYAPYYLQSVFFIIGTGCWFISELLLRQRIPYWTALLGWSLVFTNTFALVMTNLSGLFMERGVRHNWSGIFSFWVLGNLLVPFQAYAALKGLLERDEGGWHRTPKSGRITEILGRLRFGKSLKRLLPNRKKGRVLERAPAFARQIESSEQLKEAWAHKAILSPLDQSRASRRKENGGSAVKPSRRLRVPRRLRLRPAFTVIIVLVAAIAALTIMSTEVEAASDNFSTFWFYDDTIPLTYMMYQSQPNGSSTSSGSDITFYSDTFQAEQSLESGTATVYLYATNRDRGRNRTIGLTLRAGSTVIGNGSITVPRRTYSPQLFPTSFSTSTYDFAEGERLSLEVDLPFSSPVDVYWDGTYNDSRLVTATIVPEGLLGLLLLAPFIPLFIMLTKRSRGIRSREKRKAEC